MSEQALVVQPQSAEVERFMPIMNMNMAVQRRQVIVDAVHQLMKPEEDFGVIPGTKKPTLFQPGADKLNNLFGLVPRFETLQEAEDWTGKDHGGEAFFYYRVRCRLYRGDFIMGEAEGSCNSWEPRYRYRKTERVCPKCGKETIIKGKTEYGGGWVCFAKKGGCNAKWKDGAAEIEGQITGQKANPDVSELVNTILKMACKRAKIAATLNATSAHEFFTQDAEDMPGTFGMNELPETSKSEPPPQSPEEPPPAAKQAAPLTEPPEPIKTLWTRMVDFASTVKVFQELKKDIEEVTGSDRPYYEILAARGMKHANDMKGKPRSDVRMTVVALVEYLQKCKQEPSLETL